MTSILDTLSEHLMALSSPAFLEAVGRSGASRCDGIRAQKREPISADSALRLLAALGIDPMTGAAIEPRIVGALDHKLLAIGCRIRFDLDGLTFRSAADALDLSTAAIMRLRKGTPVSVVTVVKACRYLKTHPFGYCRDPMFHVEPLESQTGRAA